MITVDSRVGSVELARYLPKGLCAVSRLQYADASFLGNGAEGPVGIGIERKTLLDLLGSMQSGRLSGHQLVGLTNSYNVVYLVLEGIWKVGKEGELLRPRGGKWDYVELGIRRFMSRELDNYLNRLQIMGGVLIRETRTLYHTAVLIHNLYCGWQKNWDDHVSHLAFHKHRLPPPDGRVPLTKPPLIRRMAAELPDIENKLSTRVAEHFGSVRVMVNADKAEWVKIPGIGKVIAEKVTQVLGEG